ncbi:ATP-binding cassette domain-containing protein [Enterococcus sp. BWB1-3]|uniref:ATP-binding cassette domain-containing protein n=1 Tax=unclassified Enterococcus TaxID=2608891 RepID=UPI001924479D|nr:MULTISPECIES: ATP-binding cassette domain-containing protein [unclassified Enterococcus]MBL1230606.1 ATP-binding cassette domain-containing protein [Enterococcus sp. BWB1-3]MCB5950914.1 ATP-binding cassette domain-containing protein [Enterococcus sp. BWT-B8]MCB5955552.1 ATP-binding cassette domain-containing protein [Enterococcus sp. CWB-B31]
MNKTTHLLQVSNLTKKFNNQLLFKALDFVIDNNQWVGIEGENGMGKSTLVKMIMGLEHYSEGKIYFNGQTIAELTRQKWYQEIQLVPQYTRRSLDPTKTIKQILVEPLKRFKLVERGKYQLKIEELLDVCNLPAGLLDKRPGEISGGQYQRCCLVLALLVQPKLLICDEATAGLDKINELRMIQLIKKQKEMAVLFISHNKKLLTEVCDQRVHLKNFK